MLTFYSGQVDCIRKLLVRRFGSDFGSTIAVMTVDSFQGSESDCVILSFVRCNERNEVGFLNNVNRLNVALTRARYVLLAVGNKDTLSQSQQTTNQPPRDEANTSAEQESPHPKMDDNHTGRLVEYVQNKNRMFEAVDINLP